MLEEIGLSYKVHPVNILQGDQFDPEYLKKNPNNKVPTIVDPLGPDGTLVSVGSWVRTSRLRCQHLTPAYDCAGKPFTVFESGAILLYLGEKADRFLGGPPGSAVRHTVVQWLMFQMASVGPMFGQCGYFRNYARGSEEELRHGRERYGNETARIYRVLEKRLAASAFLGGDDYSVADMAVFPWIQPFMHGTDLSQFPALKRWFELIQERPAVRRAYQLLASDCKIGDRSEQIHANLFDKQRIVGTKELIPEPKPSTRGPAQEAHEEAAAGVRALPKIELWYTPIANHVHAGPGSLSSSDPNPKPKTTNPKPQTPNPKPSALSPALRYTCM